VNPYTALKRGQVHPEPDRYDFAGADAIVDFAEANRMRVRGHTLIWGGAADPPNPTYLNEASSANEVPELMRGHIRTLMERYRGRIDRWDVVNEPLTLFGEEGGTDGLRDNVFLQQVGLHRRGIRDGSRSGPGSSPLHQRRLRPQARTEAGSMLRTRAGPARCGGASRRGRLQAHLYIIPFSLDDIDAPSEVEMEATLRHFASLGVAVEITELNVHTWRFEGDLDARLAQQAEAYERGVRACLAVPACRAVTVWLFTDRSRTTAETIAGVEGEALLFDAEYAPKPAYMRILDVLRDAPGCLNRYRRGDSRRPSHGPWFRHAAWDGPCRRSGRDGALGAP
jgi:endo-1,4-beta-xylanase